MQILINGAEVSESSFSPPLPLFAGVEELRSRIEADTRAAGHAVADFQLSPSRARHVGEVLLCEVETMPIAEMLAPIFQGIATLAKDAPELHRLTAASIRGGDEDAGELLDRTLSFWGLLAEALSAVREMQGGKALDDFPAVDGHELDTIQPMIEAIAALLEAAERGEGSPVTVADIVESLASDAERFRDRFVASATIGVSS